MATIHDTHALVQGRLYRETDKAICLDVCPQGFLWFPKKPCHVERYGENGENVNLYVPFWLARQKGL